VLLGKSTEAGTPDDGLGDSRIEVQEIWGTPITHNRTHVKCIKTDAGGPS
jgi:hypothetical protein